MSPNPTLVGNKKFEELQRLSDYQYYIKKIQGTEYIHSFLGNVIGRNSDQLIDLLIKSHKKD